MNQQQKINVMSLSISLCTVAYSQAAGASSQLEVGELEACQGPYSSSETLPSQLGQVPPSSW